MACGEHRMHQGRHLREVLPHQGHAAGGGVLLRHQLVVARLNALHVPGGINRDRGRGNPHQGDQQHDFGSQTERKVLHGER